MRLRSRVAIVTGGGRGIGAGIAMRLVAEGAKVIIAQRDEQSAQNTVAEIKAHGGHARFIQTDVSNPEAVNELVAATLRNERRLDILVNNAGIAGTTGNFIDLPLERWEQIINVNLTGVFLCGQAAARAMRDRGTAGRIINISSINSILAQVNASAYVAAKGGVTLLTKAMAVDLAQYRILVNCVAPGSIRVERNANHYDREPMATMLAKGVPLGHAGVPSDIGAAVAFLASDDASFITGSTLVVDGGFTAFFRIE